MDIKQNATDSSTLIESTAGLLLSYRGEVTLIGLLNEKI